MKSATKYDAQLAAKLDVIVAKTAVDVKMERQGILGGSLVGFTLRLDKMKSFSA